jgi:ATP-dependent exoDNAse (exonuclease V) beta subunit
LDAKLLAADPDLRLAMARRLERAVAEFDTATIGTIHSICARVLRMAGIEPGAAGDDDLLERTVAEAVNDAVVTEAAAGHGWDEGRLTDLVTAALRDPFIVPWFDPAEHPPEERTRLERAVAIVRDCVAGVQAAMRVAPSFDDLLRLAWEEVRRPERAGLVAELRRRFRLAIVDDAQDTSRLQWEFFHELFPAAPEGANTAGDDGRRLVAVGDPKQAIYGFRGADLRTYLRARGDAGRAFTLDANYRSAKALVAATNALFVGHPRPFVDAGIAAQEVRAAAEPTEKRIVGDGDAVLRWR